VLHALVLNTNVPVHEQLAHSKIIKYLEKMLLRPPFAGLDMAVAQLLTDVSFICGCASAEE